MKPEELKRQYVTLRAEGKSYSFICEQLHIAKATCTKWEKELKTQIDDIKRLQLAELCESYGMAKEARIKRLGDTLDKINQTLDNMDFIAVEPGKLLDIKLKYMEALKAEYVSANEPLPIEGINPEQIVTALSDLLNRVRTGDITTEQAQRETFILTQLLKAYDTVEIKTRVDALEAVVGGRQ